MAFYYCALFQTRSEFLHYREMLIPELVTVHAFSRELWMQLQLFPFAMQRIDAQLKTKKLVALMKGDDTEILSGTTLSWVLFQTKCGSFLKMRGIRSTS